MRPVRCQNDKGREPEHQREEEVVVENAASKHLIPGSEENFQTVAEEGARSQTAEQGGPDVDQKPLCAMCIERISCGSSPQFIGQIGGKEIGKESQNDGVSEIKRNVLKDIADPAGECRYRAEENSCSDRDEIFGADFRKAVRIFHYINRHTQHCKADHQRQKHAQQ